MNIQEIIDFQPLPSEAPNFTCNGCGKITTGQDSRKIMTIHPFVEEGSEYSVVVCGERCEERFKNPKFKDPVNRMFMEGILQSARMGNETIKDEYLMWETA